MRFWVHTIALFAVMFGGFEVLGRLAIGHSPRERADPRYDRLPLPHEPVVHSSEGFSRGRTNELGHLDAPLPRPLPADGILVVGDSYTEARQVALAERFTDRLGARLGRRVYNAGHTGWSPINAVAFITAERATFAPATVIVQVSGNDLGDIVTPRRPHVVEQGSGLAIAWPDRVKRGTARRITDLRLALSRSAFAADLLSASLTLLGGGRGDDEGDAGASKAGACTEPDPRVARALPWLVGELAKTHPDVRLLYLPLLEYHGGCVDTCAAGRDLYRRAAELAHVPLIDVTDALCARFRATRQPLHGFWNTVPGTGHLNSEGHAVVADVLAAALRR